MKKVKISVTENVLKMKSNFIILRDRVFFVLAIAGSLTLSSCLKNNGPIQDFSQTPNLLTIQGDGQYNGIFATALTVSPGTPASVVAEVTLSTPSLYLKTPVSGTLVVDTATLSEYNAASGTSLIMLPGAAFTLPNSGSVTVAPGTQIYYDTIAINQANIPFGSNNYALALLLTNAQGANAEIPSNLKQEVVVVTLKNTLEDSFSISGTRTVYNGATTSSGVKSTVTLSGTFYYTSASWTAVDGQVADLTQQVTLQVNTDNSVTVEPSVLGPGNTFAGLVSDGTSTYNAGTKTFTLSYKYIDPTTGSLTQVNEVLVGR